MGAGEGQSLSRQTATPWSLEAVQSPVQVWGTLVTMSNLTSPVWATCAAWLFDAGLSFPLHSGCGISNSACQELEGSAQGESLTRLDEAPLSNQGSYYGAPPPFPSPCTAWGDIWLLSQLAEHGHQSNQFLSGLLHGNCLFCRHFCRDQLLSGLLHFLWSRGIPNSGTWIPSISSVVGVTGVSTGMGPGSIFLAASPEGLHPPEWHHLRRPHMVQLPTSTLEHILPKAMVGLVLVD